MSLTRAKIDGDVIEEFVRHTARFVDHLYVVDNASPDGTLATLDALVAEGLPLTILRDAVIELDYERLMTAYARDIFAQQQADFLLVLDADEFVIAPDRATLELALRSLPEGAHAAMPWVTYIPTAEDDDSEPRVVARICNRLVTELRPYYKVIVARSFANELDWWLTAGAHAIGAKNGEPAIADLPGVALAHFPVREIRQIQAKALLGWSALLASGYDEENGVAYQWRNLYYRLFADHRWAPHDLYYFALNYLTESNEAAELCYAPLPPVDRRHTKMMPELLDVALRFSRQLAIGYGELLRTSRLNDNAECHGNSASSTDLHNLSACEPAAASGAPAVAQRISRMAKFALRSLPARGYVDEVLIETSSGATIPATNGISVAHDETLLVRGWAIDQSVGAVTARRLAIGVVATVAGTADLEATYGTPRDDVAAALDDSSLRLCGFLVRAPASSIVAALGPGRHEVILNVLMAEGSTVARLDRVLTVDFLDADSVP